MRKIILAMWVVFPVFALQAQIRNVELVSPKLLQYERADFSVQLTGSWNNPYQQEEITLDMIVKAPEGKELVVPCYYVAGKSGELSTWAARFTPQLSGKYQYQFRLTEKGAEKSLSEMQAFVVKPSKQKGFLHIRNNWVLAFDNGEPFKGIAENLCWESRANDDSKYFKALHEKHDVYNYDHLIPLFAKNGGNFCRVWMCSWNFPIDRKNNFNNIRYTASDDYFNPSAVGKLDQFIDLCKEKEVYLMLCMGPGDVRADQNFFTSEESKIRYKNRLRYIVARWGYSPNIAMWEFFNEIDNIQYQKASNPIPAADIVSWHTEMSKYLKAVDPYNHIRTTSISHRDLAGLNSVPDLDINQKHIYKNTTGIPAEIDKYVKEFGKPYVIGEFGYEWDWSKNFDDFSAGMDFDFKRGLWYGLFTATPVTPMSWWWEYFENRGLMTYFRGVREISNSMLDAGKGEFAKVDVYTDGLEARGVRCGNKIFMYLLNQSDKKVSTFVNVEIPGLKTVQGKSFQPETCQYSDLKHIKSMNNKVIVENISLEAHGEMVLILSGK